MAVSEASAQLLDHGLVLYKGWAFFFFNFPQRNWFDWLVAGAIYDRNGGGLDDVNFAKIFEHYTENF